MDNGVALQYGDFFVSKNGYAMEVLASGPDVIRIVLERWDPATNSVILARMNLEPSYWDATARFYDFIAEESRRSC